MEIDREADVGVGEGEHEFGQVRAGIAGPRPRFASEAPKEPGRDLRAAVVQMVEMELLRKCRIQMDEAAQAPMACRLWGCVGPS